MTAPAELVAAEAVSPLPDSVSAVTSLAGAGARPGESADLPAPVDVDDELEVAAFMLRTELAFARRAIDNYVAGVEVVGVVEARAERVREAFSHYSAARSRSIGTATGGGRPEATGAPNGQSEPERAR